MTWQRQSKDVRVVVVVVRWLERRRRVRRWGRPPWVRVVRREMAPLSVREVEERRRTCEEEGGEGVRRRRAVRLPTTTTTTTTHL